jgi:hypothetical protein
MHVVIVNILLHLTIGKVTYCEALTIYFRSEFCSDYFRGRSVVVRIF